MKFHELKKQAEADGMVVSSKTKKVDIESFYASLETKVVKDPSKCRICGRALYHGLCSKHGRM